MGCFLETKNGEKFAALSFKRSMLLYDIKNYVYIEGSVLPGDTEVHNRHMVQDIGEEGNVDRVSRVLDLYHSQVKEMLYPYTKHEVHSEVIENVLREPETYVIVLKLPTTFSQTTLLLLEKLIHEYLVCKVVEDWMSITNPTKVETWRQKAEEHERSIQTTLTSRRSMVRRKLHPF